MLSKVLPVDRFWPYIARRTCLQNLLVIFPRNRIHVEIFRLIRTL